MPVTGLLTMLDNGANPQPKGSGMGGGGGRGGGDGDGDDGDDAGDNAAATAAVVALAAMEDSDSDDDDMQRKMYVEPVLNRRREYIDMFLHLLFILLFFFAVYTKRDLRDAFAMSETLQTIFVDEQFGDYNEKVQTLMAHTSPGLYDSHIHQTWIICDHFLPGVPRRAQLRGGMGVDEWSARWWACSCPSLTTSCRDGPACMHGHMHACMYMVCMHACMYMVCMHACMQGGSSSPTWMRRATS